MTAREVLAEAVNVVDGVEVAPYKTNATGPGRGWIEITRTEYPGGKKVLGAWDYFAVLIELPADTGQAQKWIDDHRKAITDALWPVMVIVQIRPERVQITDGPIIKAMVVEGRREAEEL